MMRTAIPPMKGSRVVVLDILIAIVFALLAVYYGMRAARQRREGDPRARGSLLVTVLAAVVATGWVVLVATQVS